jgi:hypothetical protein
VLRLCRDSGRLRRHGTLVTRRGAVAWSADCQYSELIRGIPRVFLIGTVGDTTGNR